MTAFAPLASLLQAFSDALLKAAASQGSQGGSSPTTNASEDRAFSAVLETYIEDKPTEGNSRESGPASEPEAADQNKKPARTPDGTAAVWFVQPQVAVNQRPVLGELGWKASIPEGKEHSDPKDVSEDKSSDPENKPNHRALMPQSISSPVPATAMAAPAPLPDTSGAPEVTANSNSQALSAEDSPDVPAKSGDCAASDDTEPPAIAVSHSTQSPIPTLGKKASEKAQPKHKEEKASTLEALAAVSVPVPQLAVSREPQPEPADENRTPERPAAPAASLDTQQLVQAAQPNPSVLPSNAARTLVASELAFRARLVPVDTADGRPGQAKTFQPMQASATPTVRTEEKPPNPKADSTDARPKDVTPPPAKPENRREEAEPSRPQAAEPVQASAPMVTDANASRSSIQQTEPAAKTPEPPRPAEPPQPKHASEPQPAAVRDIRLEVNGPDHRVELHLTERAGEVHVAVRTPDSRLATDLRENLPELSSRLEQTGFRAEGLSHDLPSTTVERRDSPHLAESNAGDTGQGRHSPEERHGGQSHQQQHQRPRTPQEIPIPKTRRKDFAWFLSTQT